MIRKILIFTFAFVFSVQATAQVLSSADSRAKRNFRFNTKEELAAGLTEGFTDETRKARAIAAWMAFNIEKNGFRERQLIRASGAGYLADPLLPNDIFETRIGTPQEFAKLYAELAGMAGLEATIIDGYAGYRIRGYKKDPKPVYAAADAVLRMTGAQDYRFQQYEASWNAVKIKEEWKLLDVYWMIPEKIKGANGIANERAMRLFLERRAKNPSVNAVTNTRIDEKYFFPKPRDFIKTHFPNDSIWQMIQPPRKWSSFAK